MVAGQCNKRFTFLLLTLFEMAFRSHLFSRLSVRNDIDTLYLRYIQGPSETYPFLLPTRSHLLNVWRVM